MSAGNKMLLIFVLLKIALVVFVFDKTLADVEMACPRLSVPLGTETVFHCSTTESSAGLDISSDNLDVPIYGTAEEGYTVTRGLLTVAVVEKTSAILNVSVTFNVSLTLLNRYITCTSFHDGEYETCLVSYPSPHFNPHALVQCEEKNEDGCSLTSLSWNCSKNQLPLKEVEVWLGNDDKAIVSGDTCTHYFGINGTGPTVNLTLVGHYVTNYSSTVTALIELHSPFQISRNESEDGNTVYVFDLVEEQKPSRLLELNVVQSNFMTIQKEATAPLFLPVPRNVNITYSVRTILVSGGITVSYEENGTRFFQSNHENNTTVSGASALEHYLFLIFLCSTLVKSLTFS